MGCTYDLAGEYAWVCVCVWGGAVHAPQFVCAVHARGLHTLHALDWHFLSSRLLYVVNECVDGQRLTPQIVLISNNADLIIHVWLFTEFGASQLYCINLQVASLSVAGRISSSFSRLEQQIQRTWNECEIKSEYDEAGKRLWKWAPCRFCGVTRCGRARFWLISVSKYSHEASVSSHTTPIISLPIRHLCVSICRVLFKWEVSSVWACWHLSPCLSVLTGFNSLWRSASCYVWIVRGEELGYARTISLRWHSAEGKSDAGILLLVLFCGL